jgi:ubiquinol-cytochrome c reductase cytochrome b subunit
MLVLAAMPFVGNWRLGHRFNVAFLWAMLVGVGALTSLAVKADRNNPDYAIAVRAAERDAHRAVALAQSPDGIPPTGAVTLLRNDAFTQGPKLFAKNCASCHRYEGHDGLGGQPKDPASAADLKGFASRAWLAGLLDPEKITTAHYFGGSKLKNGKMVKFVREDVASFSEAQKKELQKAIAALSAEARLPSQRELDKDEALIGSGTKALIGATLSCVDCHKFHEDGEEFGTAPDLTGYGSRDWLIAFIGNPEHVRFYGERNDRMPAFGEEKQLTPQEIGLVTDWLRGEWYEPGKMKTK